MKERAGNICRRRQTVGCRKTKTQLRNGLAMLMKEKSVGEITVKELVDQVDINRSTFYLHYPDISGLLYEIENDLSEEMERAIREHPIEKREDNGFYFLQDIFQVLDNNREIVSALVGSLTEICDLFRKWKLFWQETAGKC